jgi:hypothetical protein
VNARVHTAPDGRQYATWMSRTAHWAHQFPVRTAPLADVRRALDAGFRRQSLRPSRRPISRRRFMSIILPPRKV